MQPVAWDMFYTEGYTLAMVHAASHGAVIKNQDVESHSLRFKPSTSKLVGKPN